MLLEKLEMEIKTNMTSQKLLSEKLEQEDLDNLSLLEEFNSARELNKLQFEKIDELKAKLKIDETYHIEDIPIIYLDSSNEVFAVPSPHEIPSSTCDVSIKDFILCPHQ